MSTAEVLDLHPTTRPPRAAIYVRISRDALKRGLGVARQERDCREHVERRGWTVAEIYEDDDRSATRKDGKAAHRPRYAELLADVKAGRVDAVVAWELDRLVRDPLEHEEFLLLCERVGMHHLSTLADEVNIETGEGIMVARIKAAVAAEEVRKMGKRVRRKLVELAEAGKPGGGVRPFGWQYRDTRVDSAGKTHGAGPLVLVPAEADFLREAATRVLEGRSLTALIREWNAAGHTTAQGRPWRTTTLRETLLRPRIAGLRVHQGVVVGDADWEPILERATWEAVATILNNPSRRPSGHARTYLLTGLTWCTCGRRLGGSTRGRAERAYVCRPSQGGCGASTGARPLEAIIVGTLFKVAADRKVTAALTLAGEGEDDARLLADEVASCDRKLAELAELWGSDEIGRAEWLSARNAVERRKEVAQRSLAEREQKKASVLAGFLGRDDDGRGLLETAWPDLTTEKQRAILAEAVARIEVRPAGAKTGRRFDSTRINPEWIL